VDRLTGVFDHVGSEARLSEGFERALRFGEDLVLVLFDVDESSR
jgi:hypothetical protein